MIASHLRIGTAGWNVPSRYAAEIPPVGSHLERYARRLNAVEINSSFYRPHRRKTYERWAAATPEDFQFSVKVPRSMTHERKLAGCEPLLDRFAEEVAGLGSKLAVLLVQLPPRLVFEDRDAEGFFRELSGRVDASIVLEPRNASWFAPGLNEWLAKQRVARVAADPAPVAGAGDPGGWDRLTYFRWHGSPRIYYSDYEAGALAELKRRMQQRQARGPVWCIFDNTAAGAALGNAMAIQ